MNLQQTTFHNILIAWKNWWNCRDSH